METKWTITDHVCRACLGRVLSRYDKNGRQHVRCADCGLEASGNHKSLCACGDRTRAGKDRGHRCAPNPDAMPGIEPEIMITVGNPVDRHPADVPRRAGRFVAPSSRVPPGQESMSLENEDGEE